jgi:hypothetical protein
MTSADSAVIAGVRAPDVIGTGLSLGWHQQELGRVVPDAGVGCVPALPERGCLYALKS